MTTNQTRAEILVRALDAAIERDHAALAALCTHDVQVWTPALSTRSLDELIEQLDHRDDDAFADIELASVPLDVGGDYACVEWTVAMTHTGTLTLTDNTTIEPTGIRITVHGATIAEYHDQQICSLRQYWDELDLLEQLGVTTAPSGPSTG